MLLPRSRRILALLAASTVIPILVLGGLSLSLLRQQRDAERQRRADALGVEANRLADDIDTLVKDIESRLEAGNGVVLAIDALRSSSPLLFQPGLTSSDPVPAAFAAAEGAEFQAGSLKAAADEYRRLATTGPISTRGLALLGLGRAMRKRGDLPGALGAYADLELLGTQPVTGVPAALLARFARLRALVERSNDVERTRSAAQDLARALAGGGWSIDRATYIDYSAAAERSGGGAPDRSAVARTDAIIELWQSWRGGNLPASGRKLFMVPHTPAVVLWSTSPKGPAAWVATADEVERMLRPLSTARWLDIGGVTGDGQLLFGADRQDVVLLAANRTRLPLVLRVAPLDGFASASVNTFGRATLAWVLIGAFALMVTAAFGVWRATAREFALAQQQADFVSAVSHEFRTPLTSMRHLLDLLSTRGVTDEDKRTQYYGLLTHETDRLHHMVESLLSFGRMEAGAYAWKREPVDLPELVGSVVRDIRSDDVARGREVSCAFDESLPVVTGDPDALALAVRNLAENAAKYSPPGTPIRVVVTADNGFVRLRVIDQGPGIPAAEQSRVFQKFVRGEAAQHAGVRGVGIGLALVRQIADAHGGSVAVESAPDLGSTFTISLPIQAGATEVRDAVSQSASEARP